MTEYAIQTSFKGNYFEWLYFINNNRVASREELVNSMINYLRSECVHRLDSDKNVVSSNKIDINSMLRNSCLAQIKIVKRNDGYFYNKTIILQYKNKIYYYPEDINSIELKNTLFDMYDDKVFDKFI